MLKQERIKFLQEYVEKERNDPFPRYALAMEFLEIEPKKAENLFIELLELFPEYLPTYYHAAAFFAEKGEFNRAKNIYEKGIELAEKNKVLKSLHELKAAYQNFLFDLDE